MKILIADDEPKIRRGLVRTLERSPLNLHILPPAKNGLEALSTIKEEKPDLALVDICMPKMSGLQLIEAIQDLEHPTKIIIISGHDEFEYAKAAISLNVSDYLLKPIDKEHLFDLLEKINEEVEEERYHRAYEHWSAKQIKRNLTQISSQFFDEWIKGYLLPDQVKNSLQHMDLDMKENMALYVIHILPRMTVYGEQWHAETLCFAVSNIVDEVTRAYTDQVYLFRYGEKIILLVPWHLQHKKLLEDIQGNILNYLNQYILIDYTRVSKPIEELPQAYKSLSNALTSLSKISTTAMAAKNHMDKHFRQKDYSLMELADNLNVAPSYLSRLIKEELQSTFTDYVALKRLTTAKEIMDSSSSQLKIYEIADAVGYANQHYFCKVFKKAYGKSPSEYRKVDSL